MSNLSAYKTLFRQFVFPTVTLLHLEKLFARLSNNNKLILIYHGVVSEPENRIGPGPLGLKQFEQHLAYFKQNFSVVSLKEIFEMHRNNYKPTKKTIALTFDDGYKNNYTLGFPLLQKAGFPATMFIITQSLIDETKLTWYDYVDIVKNDLNLEALDVAQLKLPKPANLDELRKMIKSLNIEKRNLLFDELNKQVKIKEYLKKINWEHWKLMNRQEIIELANSDLIEVGAHSQNHPNLGEVDINDAKKEVTQCKELLENLIQKEVYSIAFPDGSYNEAVKKVCIDAGYTNLLAVDYRCSGDKEDKSILPRYCLSSTTTFDSNIIQVNRHFKLSGF